MDNSEDKVAPTIQNDDIKEENINTNSDVNNEKVKDTTKPTEKETDDNNKNNEKVKDIVKPTDNDNKVDNSGNKEEIDTTKDENKGDTTTDSEKPLGEGIKKKDSLPTLSSKSSLSSITTPKSILRKRRTDGNNSDGSTDDVSSISSAKKKHIEFSDDNIVYTLDREEDYEDDEEDDEAYKGHPPNYDSESIIYYIFGFIRRYLLFALVIAAGFCFSYYSYNSNNKKSHSAHRQGFNSGRKNKPGPPSIQWDKATSTKMATIKPINSLTLSEVISAEPTTTTSVFQEETSATPVVAPGEQQQQKEDQPVSSSEEKKSEPVYERVVAIGDIHGDFKKLMKLLRTANLVDSKGNWSAKNTILVQTGDLIDRGSDTILVFDLMMKIKEQAKKYNSIVYMLLGNHEVMNLQEDFRYVTRGDVMSFGGMPNRKKAFSMEGKYGNLLRNEMNATMIVDDTLFVHAGLISVYAKFGVEQMNKHTHHVLQNYPPEQLFYAPLFNNNGPFWTRFMSLGPEEAVCEELKMVMETLKVNRMVVGHTVQENGKINTRCNNKFLMIDVGMAEFYGDGFAYLEFLNDKKEIWAVYSETEREKIN